MKFTIGADHAAEIDLVGGKGGNLQRLVGWGAHVAPFFVITTEAHAAYLTTKRIPEEVRRRVEGFLRAHETIVLRSSMVGEDQSDASFAGMFETILGVTAESWEAALQKIYASVDAPRVREYLKLKQLSTSLKMAVVVQKEIRVEKSGVLFTRSPVSPTSALVIDAARGMGEGVVSGHAAVDNYQLVRTGELIRQSLAEETPVLDKRELKLLIGEALRLEASCEAPADIEWGLRGDELFIFQIRPITRAFPRLKVFADTNLSESYPGVVSPFTAAFVKKAYENVFTESALILGAKGERLRLLKSHYANLIARVGDHLYYDLEHYYAVLRALPGGEVNITNWHRMIGGDVGSLTVPRHATELSSLEALQAVGALLRLAFRKKRTYACFLADLEAMNREIKQNLDGIDEPTALMRWLSELIERPLGFGLTVVNDVYIMIGLGLLTDALEKKGLPASAVLGLLRTTGELDSIKPLRAFNQLLETFSPEFVRELERLDADPGADPYQVFLQTARAKGFAREAEALGAFVREYGDRSFEELKIESLPLKNDPKLLKDLVAWGRKHAAPSPAPREPGALPPLSWWETRVLNFTRDCIEMREASRLWRGRYYHLLRETMIKLAAKLQAADARWREFALRDFFAVDHHEWLGFAEGKLRAEDIEYFMRARKSWQQKGTSYPEVVAWVPSEDLPVLGAKSSLGELQGQGVAGGRVRASALVLENPTEVLTSTLADFILVTKNTDPAWVYIMSRSRGLVSEKGSLLSHTAIIGRELGIPTLVGVKAATQLIKTGDLIEIDGTTGEIRKL